MSMIVIVALACSQVPPAWANAGPSGTKAPAEQPLFANRRYNPERPDDALKDLRDVMAQRDLTYEECLDYGTAWFFKGEWGRAVVSLQV